MCEIKEEEEDDVSLSSLKTKAVVRIANGWQKGYDEELGLGSDFF